jgi:selenocysteine-specific elongation factor
MLRQVRAHFAGEPTLTAAQFRDRFNTSRKYALAFLEHLDALGVTLREGDFRRLKNG